MVYITRCPRVTQLARTSGVRFPPPPSHENDSAALHSPRAALLGHACQRSGDRYRAHRSAHLGRATPRHAESTKPGRAAPQFRSQLGRTRFAFFTAGVSYKINVLTNQLQAETAPGRGRDASPALISVTLKCRLPRRAAWLAPARQQMR